MYIINFTYHLRVVYNGGMSLCKNCSNIINVKPVSDKISDAIISVLTPYLTPYKQFQQALTDYEEHGHTYGLSEFLTYDQLEELEEDDLRLDDLEYHPDNVYRVLDDNRASINDAIYAKMGGHTLGEINPNFSLKTSGATGLFQPIVVLIEDEPKVRTMYTGYFSAEKQTLMISLDAILDTFTEHGDIEHEVRGVVEHELIHAADWAYKEATRAGKFESDALTDRAKHLPDIDKRHRWAPDYKDYLYYNLDIEMKAHLANAVQDLHKRYGDRVPNTERLLIFLGQKPYYRKLLPDKRKLFLAALMRAI